MWYRLQEAEEAEFEAKKRQWEQEADAKTAKNRAKRQKKKERAKGKGTEHGAGGGAGAQAGDRDGKASDVPLKKRRLVNGQELVFKRRGDESDEEDEDVGPLPDTATASASGAEVGQDAIPVVDVHQRIVIHEED